MKRITDVLISSVALVLLAPLLVTIAFLIILTSGWPILFSQERVGRDFRSFRLYKFRSMRNVPQGPKITVARDSRITWIGGILRRTKLDELPQLWNVLKGDMSLVGPRPEVPEYVDMFKDRYRRILTVRPGITDLASIQFRNEEALLANSANPQKYYLDIILPAKLNLADEYLAKQSFFLDLRLVARTICVIGGRRVW